MGKDSRPKRVRNVCFCTHPFGVYPRADLEFDKDGNLIISVFGEKGKPGFSIRLNRKLARMIAKRINQALDFFYGKDGDS